MFGDFGKIMKLAGQMKKKLPEMKQRLAAAEYTAEVGGGAVVATVNGKMQLVKIRIDPDRLTTAGRLDREMLEDLVQVCVSSAQGQAAAAAKEAMNELTGGMELPGLDGLM